MIHRVALVVEKIVMQMFVGKGLLCVLCHIDDLKRLVLFLLVLWQTHVLPHGCHHDGSMEKAAAIVRKDALVHGNAMTDVHAESVFVGRIHPPFPGCYRISYRSSVLADTDWALAPNSRYSDRPVWCMKDLEDYILQYAGQTGSFRQWNLLQNLEMACSSPHRGNESERSPPNRSGT
jgi:hypothetical protein